jgi:hypothetical protein
MPGGSRVTFPECDAWYPEDVRRLLAALAIALLAACAGPATDIGLDPVGRSVIPITVEPEGCVAIGPVEGGGWGAPIGDAKRRGLSDLRNRAGRLGANFVVLTGTRYYTEGRATRGIVSGVAYACPPDGTGARSRILTAWSDRGRSRSGL